MLAQEPARNPIPRPAVVEEVRRLLKASDKEQPKRILNLYGMAGIGKSTTSRMLVKTFKSENFNVIRLGFELPKNPIPEETKMWAGADAALRTIPTLSRYLPGRTPEGLSDKVLLVDSSTATLHSGPVLLLLDGLDDLPFWKWLQEYVIRPALEQTGSVVVCASQTPLYWNFWDLREKAHVMPLEAFKASELKQIVDQSPTQDTSMPEAAVVPSQQILGSPLPQRLRDCEQLQDLVVKASYGLPLVLESMLAQFAEDLEELRDDQEELEIAEDILKRRIAADILEHRDDIKNPQASEATAGKLSADAYFIAGYLAIIRRVEVTMLRALLDKRDRHEARERYQPPSGIIKINAALRELKSKRLIKRYRVDQPEQFLGGLRVFVRKHMDRHEYRELCEYLEREYLERAVASPKSEAESFLEWLYMSLELMELDAEHAPSNLDTRFKQWEKDLLAFFERAKEFIISAPVKRSANVPLAIMFYRDDELYERFVPRDTTPDPGLLAIKQEMYRKLKEQLEGLQTVVESFVNESDRGVFTSLAAANLSEFVRATRQVTAEVAGRFGVADAESTSYLLQSYAVNKRTFQLNEEVDELLEGERKQDARAMVQLRSRGAISTSGQSSAHEVGESFQNLLRGWSGNYKDALNRTLA